jgi:hypothetical protein
MSDTTSAAPAALPPVLKGLSERQLKFVRFLVEQNFMLDIEKPSVDWQRIGSVNLYSPIECKDTLTPLRKVLNIRYYGNTRHPLKQLGAALLAKKLLVEVAEIKPEVPANYAKNIYYQGRKVRYALSNEVIEAAGGVVMALEEIAAKEEAKIERQAKWDAARAPFDVRSRDLNAKFSNIRTQWRSAIELPIEQIEQIRTEYATLVCAFAALNEEVAKLAAEHGREPVKYDRY